jgi:hypothetical protein
LRTVGSASDSGILGDRIETLHFESTNQYASMVDAFASSVAAGVLLDPAEDGLHQMMVLDRLVRSLATTAPGETGPVPM